MCTALLWENCSVQVLSSVGRDGQRTDLMTSPCTGTIRSRGITWRRAHVGCGDGKTHFHICVLGNISYPGGVVLSYELGGEEPGSWVRQSRLWVSPACQLTQAVPAVGPVASRQSLQDELQKGVASGEAQRGVGHLQLAREGTVREGEVGGGSRSLNSRPKGL